MTNRYLLDIERLKKLEPIMEGLGVEHVDLLLLRDHGLTSKWELNGGKTLQWAFGGKTQNTYDYAALESVLPDWLFDKWSNDEGNFNSANKHRSSTVSFIQIYSLVGRFKLRRGQAKLESMADLIILLHENGIGLRGSNEI